MPTTDAIHSDTNDPMPNGSTPQEAAMTTETTTTTPSSPRPPRMLAAYRRREAEMRALEDEELAPLNLDLVGAVVTIQGVLPQIRALRDEMKTLPGIDLATIDALDDYTLATAQANSDWAVANAPVEVLPALIEQAVRQREVLGTEARALGARGLVDANKAKSFQSGVGFRAVAEDLQNVSNFLRDGWGKISPRTGVREEELDEASETAASILSALGIKQQAPELAAETAKMRQRAYTLMVRAYDHARRAVTFLRWEKGDADTYAPSLYSGRSNGRKKADAPAQTAAAPAATTTPPGVGPAQASATQPIPPGLPGASPFLT